MKERITLDYGDGTKKTYDLIKEVFVKKLSNPILEELSDSAKISNNLLFTCDAFTVNPIKFASSDIGKLSIYGTVNDICVSGGIPLYISLAIIVEEGFPKNKLEEITESIKKASALAGVKVVTGDFKVVEKGKIDKIFIITSGIGKKIKKANPSLERIKPKDKIIITGPIAQHGMAIMSLRNKLFEFPIESDCQSLKDILTPLWEKFPSIKFMRDPTRGGIAATLNEVSLKTKLGMILKEERIPIKEEVKSASELLGVDPYYLACEGVALIFAEAREAKSIVNFLKKKGQLYAGIIGEVTKKLDKVVVETIVGGRRILDFSFTFNLPRIC